MSRSLRSQHVLLHFPSESYQEVMFDLPTEDDAALRRAVIISWDALATHLSICGRSDQVPGVIMAKQRSTACIPACVDTMDVFFLPHAFGIVPWLVLPHGTVATRGRGVFQAHPSPRNQPRSYHLRLRDSDPKLSISKPSFCRRFLASNHEVLNVNRCFRSCCFGSSTNRL